MDIIRNIKKYATKFPDRIAYKNNNNVLTYGELEEKSNKLASELQNRAGNDKKPVIVYGHKNKYMLISFLACVKSGRAYCPVDISVPTERVKRIIDTVAPEIILSIEDLPIEDERVYKLDDVEKACNNNECISEDKCVLDSDVFYIIFTSGSTGNPKGVQITRACLNNFLEWSTQFKGIEGKDGLVFLNQAPFSFDLSVMDLYTSLATGGTLIGMDKQVQNNMQQLFELFSKSNANVWVSTPSFIAMCLADKTFNGELMKYIKTFYFCGEILPSETARKILDRFDGACVINTYGPTESTVAVTDVEITREIIDNNNSLPIGKPKKNVWIYIQNDNHENLSDGEKGEIVIVGDTVSTGYYNDIEKTNKVFGIYNVDGKEYRYYRTGDLGYISNGQLYYCGRKDFQIKLHGYRIEIEDIENNILKCLDVENVAVVPKYGEDEITVESLVAFIETNRVIENSLEEAKKVKDQLKTVLPNYMIPRKIKFIDKMPMNNNCKIDRKALSRM